MEKKYDIVIADPPWSYDGQQDKWGAAAKFYPLMSNDEIFDFPMHNFLKPRSILFLWATCPKLHIAIQAIDQWNLTYRGVAFIWIKTKKDGTPIGAQGVRPSITKPLTELVLAASYISKGRPLELFDESVPQTIFSPKEGHSKKPDEVQQRIDSMYPLTSKIELFARYTRLGWDSWGKSRKDLLIETLKGKKL